MPLQSIVNRNGNMSSGNGHVESHNGVDQDIVMTCDVENDCSYHTDTAAGDIVVNGLQGGCTTVTTSDTKPQSDTRPLLDQNHIPSRGHVASGDVQVSQCFAQCAAPLSDL